MSTLLYRKKKYSFLLSLILILFVLVAGLSALFFLNQSQDLRQQAWIGDNDLAGVCQGGNCETADQDLFISKASFYRVNLLKNPDWRLASLADLQDLTGNDPSLFVFRNEFGFATILLDSFQFSDQEKGLTVTQLAASFEQKLKLKENYLGKEIIDLGQKTVIRFEFFEELLGQKATYYEYFIPGKSSYLEAEVRFTPSLLVDQKVTEFLNSVELITDGDGLVKGATTDKPAFAEAEITTLVKPSVANILHLYCKEIRLSNELPVNYLQRSYQFCNGNYGSGFLVAGNGLVATNGHVVTTYPEQDLIGGLNQGDQVIATFVVDFVREALSTQGLVTTAEQGLFYTQQMMQNPSGVQVLIKSIYDLLDTKAIEVVPLSEKYFINLGNESFNFSQQKLTVSNINNFVHDSQAIFGAELVGTDYANLFAKDVVLGEKKPLGSDVALLKILNDNNYTYPSLQLGDAGDLQEGDAVLVIGFPGVVSGSDGGQNLIDYESSSTKATVTRGIVSSIKQDNQGNSLIQTDATIGHGNSGGPAFNDRGEVIGIATYGIMDDVGSFNFLRDIKDLKELAADQASDLDPSASDTYLNWETALNYYWGNRFTKSLEFLTKVEESYPVHPTAENIVKDAEESIAEGKDIDLIWGMNKTVVYGFGSGFSLILMVGLVVIIINKKKNSKPIIVVQPNQDNQVVREQLPVNSQST